MTIKKYKFFNTLARDRASKSNRYIYINIGISEDTSRKWKKQKERLGDLAKRRTCLYFKVLRHKSRVTKTICKAIVSPLNPVRKHLYSTQISHYKISVGICQLQRKIKEYIYKGGRYIMAFINKVILDKNRNTYIKYREGNVYKPTFGF